MIQITVTLLSTDLFSIVSGIYNALCKYYNINDVTLTLVTVYFPENLKFLIEPRNRSLDFGLKEIVHCSADGDNPNDNPISVKWIKEGAGQLNGNVHDNGGDLTFEPVTWVDNGSYTCIAENHQGRINKTVYLSVVGKQTILIHAVVILLQLLSIF